MAATSMQFVRKASTSDLYLNDPCKVIGAETSKNGHLTLLVQRGDAVLRLNVPDWFRDQYAGDIEIDTDYISGGWNCGKFAADIWFVA